MKKAVFKMVCSMALAMMAHHSAAAEMVPAEILKRADEVRNPSESYELKVKIDNSDGSSSSFLVKMKGGAKTHIRTLAPARDKGRNLLMVGEDMWAYVPGLKRAVRVALQQKLTGEAANGDLSRMRWSGDYAAALEKEENGQWVLLLTAGRKGLTYDKIRLWVERQSFHPKKAEYLSLSGTIMKRVEFGDYRMMEGAMRPSLLVIEDAIEKKKKSRIIVEEMKKRDFPDTLFTEAQLGN
jgi:outer membrane lipoprotein-sorting protein